MDPWSYQNIMKELGEIKLLILALLDKETAMTQQLDALKAEVEQENTVIDSAVTLLNGLSAQIIALKDDPVALQALAEEVAAKRQALADAVAANTPTPTP